MNLEKYDEDEMAENWPCRELVGSLMWSATSIRPDVSNTVRAVTRFCYVPKGCSLEDSTRHLSIHSGDEWV